MKTALALFSYGGVEGRVMDALLDEVNLAAHAQKVLGYTRVHDDALISRSRSKALTDFLTSDFDVLVQVDHDVEWEPGMVMALAEEADKRKCLMSGLYSCRAKGAGHAGRFTKLDQVVHPGTDERYDAEYLPGGFLAIPRLVAEEVLEHGTHTHFGEDAQDFDNDDFPRYFNEQVTECIGLDGKPMYDFFRPIVVPSTIVKDRHEFLSEDWSFCWRAAGEQGPPAVHLGEAHPPAPWVVRVQHLRGRAGEAACDEDPLTPPRGGHGRAHEDARED